MGKRAFLLFKMEEENYIEAHYPRQCIAKFLPFLIKIHGQLSCVM